MLNLSKLFEGVFARSNRAYSGKDMMPTEIKRTLVRSRIPKKYWELQKPKFMTPTPMIGGL